jgi:hypothetical protein
VTKPLLRKFPAEIFGYSYTNLSDKARQVREAQFCPFLNDTCKKPRKSEPHIKVGVCSVGYKGNFLREYEPIIICPHRFDLNVVFEAVIMNEFGVVAEGEKIVWASEVSMGSAGSVDYVASSVDTSSGEVRDFVCLELQAAGTTGTPWQAIQEYREKKAFTKNNYNFGINWANEFAKTMMQQAYKKGLVIQSWGKKIIFAIQDVGLGYLQAANDTSGLREAINTDPIHFYTFKMFWDDNSNSWGLRFDQRWSTDTEGIRRMLAGTRAERFLTQDEFIANIKRKFSQ